MHLNAILNELQAIAPLEYAESWDNVGLLVGDRDTPVDSVMTCLTLTSTTLDEAIREKVGLIVCHHPIPFKPIGRITSDSSTGRLLLGAIRAGVAIYSPHTAWDNAATGINQQLAEILTLGSTGPLQTFAQAPNADPSVGVGRYGRFDSSQPATIDGVLSRLRTAIPSLQPRHTHSSDRIVKKIGIVCGSGGSMLGMVASRGCDAMLTGEATYHQCLDAEARGIALIMIGHHASEFFAMSSLATQLQAKLPTCRVFASQRERSCF
jgi:dinuclear metal center YbgI/SA1388 family protein